MKFKNFCPYGIGDIFITTNSINPSSIYLGTTWQKLEDVILKGTSSSNSITKQIIGSDTISIQKSNLPNIKLKTDSFSLSRGTMEIIGDINGLCGRTSPIRGFEGTGAFSVGTDGVSARSDVGYDTLRLNFTASNSWAGSTSEASPYTEALGSGTSLNIIQKSYIVNMWLRLS